jgi:molybdate transport system ATP-binding protein
MTLHVSLHHDFGAQQVDIDFTVPAHGVTALFGRSGSGKTTVLSAIGGLFRPHTGRVEIDGSVLADTEAGIWQKPEHRHVGLVFQDARLFPHMSVATNLRFGQRRAPPGPVRFDEVVDLLGLARFLTRRPHTLSGGERQRVAIGRALLAQPRVLLMDEPLASLDDERKAEILPYLSRLNRALRLPTLYVTHSLPELVRLADHVVLLRGLRVVASGTLADIATRGDLPLARRDDAGAVLDMRVAAHHQHARLTELRAEALTLQVPPVAEPQGATIRVRIPAREIILARPEAAGLAQATSIHNEIAGTVRAISPDEHRQAMLVEIAVGSGTAPALLARVTADAAARLRLAPGGAVLALIKSVSVELLDGQPTPR